VLKLNNCPQLAIRAQSASQQYEVFNYALDVIIVDGRVGSPVNDEHAEFHASLCVHNHIIIIVEQLAAGITTLHLSKSLF
jgi:hypothetical protein